MLRAFGDLFAFGEIGYRCLLTFACREAQAMRRDNDSKCEEDVSVFHADHLLGWMRRLVMKSVLDA